MILSMILSNNTTNHILLGIINNTIIVETYLGLIEFTLQLSIEMRGMLVITTVT